MGDDTQYAQSPVYSNDLHAHGPGGLLTTSREIIRPDLYPAEIPPKVIRENHLDTLKE